MTYAPLESIIPILPPDSVLRRALEEEDAELLFSRIWTLDPGHTGYRLWRPLPDRDWRDLLTLMDTYRRIRHLAAQTRCGHLGVTAVEGTKEADLITAVLMYGMRCLAEGDQAVRHMNFGIKEIEALREMRVADLYRIESLRAHCLEIALNRQSWCGWSSCWRLARPVAIRRFPATTPSAGWPMWPPAPPSPGLSPSCAPPVG